MLRSTAASTYSHILELTETNVPNYRVSGNATASLFLISFVSSLSDCGSFTTYLSLGLGIWHAAMFANQNWDKTCEYTTTGLEKVSTGLSSTLATVKENPWVNQQYNTISNKAHSLFGSKPANNISTQAPHVRTSDDDIKIKKMM